MPEEENWPDNDHDLLIMVARDICWLKKEIGNHLKHHFAINIAVVTALLATAGALLVVVLRGS